MECYSRKVNGGVTLRSLYYRKDCFGAWELVNPLESAEESIQITARLTTSPPSHSGATGVAYRSLWPDIPDSLSPSSCRSSWVSKSNHIEGNGAESKELICVKPAQVCGTVWKREADTVAPLEKSLT